MTEPAELPIVAYGHPVLRQKCADIDAAYPGLYELVINMWYTMYNAGGCGLAAPQVNVPVRIFLVDSRNTFEVMDDEERDSLFDGDEGIRDTFINARIIERSERTWTDEEGCLSIPNLSGEVERPWSITISYLDGRLEEQVKTFHGITARMIQHEYDHIEGILYLDYLSRRKQAAVKKRLQRIAEGKESARYPMLYTDDSV